MAKTSSNGALPRVRHRYRTLCLWNQCERVDESHKSNRDVHHECCTDTDGFCQRQEGDGYYAAQQPVDAPSDANCSTPERVRGKQNNNVIGDVVFFFIPKEATSSL